MFQSLARCAVCLSGALALALASGCSALIDVSGSQCDTDVQCRTQSLGDRCVEHVCVSAEGEQASGTLDSAVKTDRCSRDDDCPSGAPRCMRSQCVTDEVADKFMCAPPEKLAVESGTIKYSFKVIEFVSRKAPANLKATACRSNDVTCSKPWGPVTDRDGDGVLEFQLPRGFLGFIEVHSDALTTLSYVTKPLMVDTVDRDLQLSSRQTVEQLAMFNNDTYDDTKGVVIVEAFDCTGTPVGGVHFTASKDEGRAFYIVNNLPNSDVMTSVYDPATDAAAGGFLNKPPGFITFSARWGVDGPVLGEFNASVRANTMTFVYMYF
jgi:hypothetical protein